MYESGLYVFLKHWIYKQLLAFEKYTISSSHFFTYAR